MRVGVRRRPGTYGTAQRAALGLCLLAALAAGSARAACPAGDNLYVTLHTAFRGAAWSRSLAELDIRIPDTVCALAPRRVSVAGVQPTNWLAFDVAAGQLHLVDATWVRGTYCGLPTVTVGTPRRLPVTAAGTTPFALVNHSAFRSDQVLLAVGVTGLLVQVYTMGTASGSITGINMLSLTTRNAAQAASGIFGDADTLAGDDHGVWVTGSGGMLRHFAFDGAVWGAEEVFDIDSAQTVTAYGEDRAGTASGAVFVRQGAAFVLEGQPAAQRVRSICSRWGACGGGVVLVREGAVWRAFSSGANAWQSVNLIAHGDGRSAELLDTSWNYSLLTYQDSVTRFAGFGPAFLAPYVNSSTPYDVTTPLTVRAALADPDSNHRPAAVILRRTVGGPVSLLVNTGGDTLQHRQPELAAVVGMWQLADTSMTLTVAASSVALAARALHGAVKPTCTTTIWLADTFRTADSWARYDTILVAAGGDTLRLCNQCAPVVAAPAQGRASGRTGIEVVDRSGRCLELPLPSGTRVQRVDVFDGAGRRVASVAVDVSGLIRLPAALPHGLVCFRLQTAAGALTQVRVTLPGR